MNEMEKITEELEGKVIKEIFKQAEEVAEFHATLTSKRGENFRRRLLQALAVKLNPEQIEELRKEVSIRESARHINKLLEFGLIEVVGEEEEKELLGYQENKEYVRTKLGEAALNALRELERRLGKKEAIKIYDASLGHNAIRFFLRIYGQKRELDLKEMEIKYTSTEIGRLSLFLRRGIEKTAAIGKLGDAQLLSYREEDGNFYFPPIKARDFYQYLKALYQIIQKCSSEAGT